MQFRLIKMSATLFYTIGDWGAFQQESINIMKKLSFQMSNCVKRKKPNFIITLGDNFYDRGVKHINDPMWNTSWRDIFITPYENMQNIEWRATLGNHDYYGGYDSIEAQLERTCFDKNWHMPSENYYYRDIETNAYFIHIDTCKIYPELYHETDIMISKRQIKETLDYLEFVLQRAKYNNANWIFVFGHYHIFSNGYYKNYEIMEKRLLPLLLKYNVDVYFCGHEHNFQVLEYENLKLVINGASSYCSDVEFYNHNLNVNTKYISIKNGFTFHNLTKHAFTINFMNVNGKIDYSYQINK